MENKDELISAPEIQTGVEDKFYYVIKEGCISCGQCAEDCPAEVINDKGNIFEIDPEKCIDCGICSDTCPVGAAQRVNYKRDSLPIDSIDMDKIYFNPGCAPILYKKDNSDAMLKLLNENFGDTKLHSICCRNNPNLQEGSTIINNCAGCDRRFRSLYDGVDTISFWEVLDSLEGLKVPDYRGMKMSVHDSCGFRHKPQVHKAIRSILKKMNIEVLEAKFHGSESICCGDNLYGLVSNKIVGEKIHKRANQFPCKDLVVYCVGCELAMKSAGMKPHYLPDLLFERQYEEDYDSIDDYHEKLKAYIENN